MFWVNRGHMANGWNKTLEVRRRKTRTFLPKKKKGLQSEDMLDTELVFAQKEINYTKEGPSSSNELPRDQEILLIKNKNHYKEVLYKQGGAPLHSLGGGYE